MKTLSKIVNCFIFFLNAVITDKTSFEFFNWLLAHDRSEELKKPYSEYFLKFNTPETRNPETGKLQDWDSAFGYSNYLQTLCTQNAKRIRAEIASHWQDPTTTSDDKTNYLQTRKKKAEILQVAAKNFYKNFPFVEESLTRIVNYIDEINFLPPTASSELSHLSFKWIATSEQLSQLYELLTASPAVIDCSRIEFENAFQGREVLEGIKWLKTTNRGEPLKSLLIYFITQLQDYKLIEKFESRSLSSRITYIFKDSNNNEIKNLKQSKSSFTGFPKDQELIDEIIDEIIK